MSVDSSLLRKYQQGRSEGQPFSSYLTLCCALLGPALVGCRSTEARHLEGEVLGISRHIDALREAPNQQKAELLARLEQHPVQSAPVRQLKQLCVDAYKRHVAGLAASQRAKELLAQQNGGPGEVLEAAKEITRSEAELESARELSERCITRQGELRRSSR